MGAPAPQPFSFAGALLLAADQSLPQDPIPFNFSNQFVSLESAVLNLSGTGTASIPFGTITGVGAKGVAIRYDANQPTGALNVQVTFNAGSQAMELTPGGLLVYFNPNPVSGILSCSIAFSASCQLRTWLLG